MDSFTPDLKKKTGEPLYYQLYLYIIEELKRGNLKSGEKLPSKRQLAKDLAISRNTIETAYQLLISEGYIESKERSGYYVANIDNLLIIPGNKVLENEPEKVDEWEYDLSSNQIDIENFPKSIWNKLYRETLAESDKYLNLGRSRGELELCSEIANYLHAYRGVNCKSEQIIIGAGVEYLLGLLCCYFKGSTFALENPGYPKIRKVLDNNDITYESISIDNSGLSDELLEKSKANICYITPSHQFPSGTIMPIWRRNKILNWAYKRKDRFIIEDDYDSEFRFDRQPIPSLQGLDQNEKVIYVSTFSRTLSPAIRIAYMVLPNKILKDFQNQFKFYSSTVSRFDQITLSSFLSGGYYSRHLNRLRKIYKQKRDTLIENLYKYFGSKVKVLNEQTGNYLLVDFDLGKSESELIKIAKDNHIMLRGYSEFLSPLYTYDKPRIILGYGNLTEEKTKKVIKKLSQVWKN